MDPRGETLQRLMEVSAPGGAQAASAEQLTNAYAAALAATRVKRWSTADAAIARARAAAATHPAALRAVLLLQAELLLERGQAAQAADLVDGGDDSRPALLLASRAALGISGPSAALRRQVEALQTWVALHPSDAAAWTLLGRAYERLGQTLPSVRAQAEAQLALGDVRGASDRLRAGQRLARRGNAADSIEASIIDARLKDVELLRRRLQEEERESREL
jgi:beta-barrel assembly-enhancing protease